MAKKTRAEVNYTLQTEPPFTNACDSCTSWDAGCDGCGVVESDFPEEMEKTEGGFMPMGTCDDYNAL